MNLVTTKTAKTALTIHSYYTFTVEINSVLEYRLWRAEVREGMNPRMMVCIEVREDARCVLR